MVGLALVDPQGLVLAGLSRSTAAACCCCSRWRWSATRRWAPSAGWISARSGCSRRRSSSWRWCWRWPVSTTRCRRMQARFSWRLLIPAGMIAVPAALVAHQPDLGTAILIAATGGGMMILAGLSLRLVGALALAGAAAVPALFAFVLKPYQKARLLTFLQPGGGQERRRLSHHPVEDRPRLGRPARQGAGPGHPEPAQLPAREEHRLHLLLHGRGARLSRLRRRCWCSMRR